MARNRTTGIDLARLALAAGVLSLAGLAQGQTRYDFILVDSFNPGFGESYLWDINERNQAVGVATKFNTIGYPPIVWSESAGKEIITPGWPRAISDTGWVAGVSYVQNLVTGQVFTPPLLSGTYPILNFGGVNNAGVAVGMIQTCNCSNSGGVQQVPLIWDEVNGSRTINVPNAKGLKRVNNSNTAIGWLYGNASSEGFVVDLSTEQYTVLGDIFPAIGVGPTRANDINDAGQIVGTRNGNYPVYSYGYLYRPDSGFELLPFPGSGYQLAMTPFGINNLGVIVGEIYINGSSRAFVYTPADGTRDLNDPTLVDGLPNGYVMMTAQKINDNGWIVGYGYGGGGGIYSAYVLRPRGSGCAADFNNDGFVNGDDYDTFAVLFDAGDTGADFNHDGFVNGNDYDAFAEAFDAGC
ncbi:MAG: hypothetical protein JNL50_09470 [Phycisphaerae bacterium]|nr:hypothetical protein [Phycisphaerae bacterium]